MIPYDPKAAQRDRWKDRRRTVRDLGQWLILIAMLLVSIGGGLYLVNAYFRYPCAAYKQGVLVLDRAPNRCVVR